MAGRSSLGEGRSCGGRRGRLLAVEGLRPGMGFKPVSTSTLCIQWRVCCVCKDSLVMCCDAYHAVNLVGIRGSVFMSSWSRLGA